MASYVLPLLLFGTVYTWDCGVQVVILIDISEIVDLQGGHTTCTLQQHLQTLELQHNCCVQEKAATAAGSCNSKDSDKCAPELDDLLDRHARNQFRPNHMHKIDSSKGSCQ